MRGLESCDRSCDIRACDRCSYGYPDCKEGSLSRRSGETVIGRSGFGEGRGLSG
jgi:hypothetical protein